MYRSAGSGLFVSGLNGTSGALIRIVFRCSLSSNGYHNGPAAASRCRSCYTSDAIGTQLYPRRLPPLPFAGIGPPSNQPGSPSGFRMMNR